MTVRRVSVLPTLFTLGNVFFGFLAIALITDSQLLSDPSRASRKLATAAWAIFLAMVCDALDGRIARMTRGTSLFGAELDSLADVVSFGAAPALLAKVIAEGALRVVGPAPQRLLVIVSGLYVVCTALRLARYNVEHRASEEGTGVFRGLPSPAAAGAVASTALLYFSLDRPPWIAHAFPFFLPVLALLMVSRIPYAHLMNRLLHGRRPFSHVTEAVFVIVMAALLKEVALALAFLGYLVAGPFVSTRRWFVERRRRDESPETPL